MTKRIKKFNCSPKLNKKVVIPRRVDLLPILEELRPKVVNQFIPKDDLVNIIGVHIGQRFNVYVKHAESMQVEQNDMDFNSFYDGGLDEADECPIEVFIITNPMNDIIMLDSNQFDIIIRRIADNLAHECIHMYQYRSRDFLEPGPFYVKDTMSEEEEEQLYLSDPDEIMAYAHNITNELLEKGDFQTVKDKLGRVNNITLEDSVNLWAYITAFNKQSTHPVMKRLLKKIYRNLIEFSKNVDK